MKPQLQKITLVLIALFIISFGKVKAECTRIYGVISDGGDNNAGAIFKTDNNGDNYTIVYNFSAYKGENSDIPLCQTDDGKLYGITHRPDCIFEWDPVTNMYIIKFEFIGGENGSSVNSLLLATNGKLYGTTHNGGQLDAGVIFEWDPKTNIFSKKFDFDGENGGYPCNALIQATNEKIYGMTYRNGLYDDGVIFEWDPELNIYTKIFDFNGSVNGKNPKGSLLQANNGKLYGTTTRGGMNNKGLLFELDLASKTFVKLFDFDGDHGEEPNGSLVQARNGKIYGETNKGGIYSHIESEIGWVTDGVIFEWDPLTNKLTKKFDFNLHDPEKNPASIIHLENGKLYGVTSDEDYNNSLLVEWDTTNFSYSVIKEIVGRVNGSFGSMMLANNGKIYGLGDGGIAEVGVLYEWNPSTNIYLKKIDLSWAAEGGNPYGSIILASDKKAYGMTFRGGLNNCGTLFQWDPNTNIYLKKIDLNGSETGSYPYGSLLEAENGILYGMTHQGGLKNCGVIFEWDPITNIYTKKYDFDKTNGSMPYGTMIKANNGKFYGATRYGGLYGVEGGGSGYGVLFEWDPISNIYSKKIDFNGTEKGKNPCGSLVLAKNGKLYGMTNGGGTNIRGVLFEWDPSNNTYTKKIDFNGANNGSNPNGSLILDENGKLYGMTSGGGTSGYGVLFEYDPSTNTYTKKLDFEHKYGTHPKGSLMRAYNGKYYGITNSGGASSGNGILFEWDPLSNTCIKKKEFSTNERPIGDLVEIYYSTSDTINDEACNSYTSPGGKTWTCSGTYKDTIPNSAGCDSIIVINLKIKKSTKKTICPAVCDSYTSPNGKIWTCSGTYKDTIPNSVGCDSVIIVKLKIKKGTTNTICPAVCDSYTSPSGKIWTYTGTYNDTIPNAAGCDSIITVNLTIKNTASIINPVACYSYISPSGKIWTNSGEYLDTVPNTVGCDSIISVYLTVNSANASVMQDQKMLTANATGAIYQWLDCNNSFAPIEGETKQTFTADEAGRYAVIVSENGCTDTSDCYYVTSFNSLDFQNTHNITLYPNPTDGSIYINLDRGYTNALLTISSYDGKVIQKENYNNIQVISLKLAQKPGIYIATVACENETLVFKIVKY